jgi:hypothetical protein
MPTDDLRAMQRDLDAVHAALDLNGQSVDNVRGHALIAVAGLLTLAWVAVAPTSLQLFGFLSVLIPTGYLVALGAKHREARDGSPAVRRELWDAVRVLLLGIPIVAYTFWAQRLGVPPLVVLATAVFFVGVMMVGGSRHQPALACWGLSLLAGALLLPVRLASPVVVIAAVLAVAGAVSAAITRYSDGR